MVNFQSLSYEKECYITHLPDVNEWVEKLRHDVEFAGYTVMYIYIYTYDNRTNVTITAIKGVTK
jgi:hypothetical protein